MDTTSEVVRRLWALCNVLRDDGIAYQDYLSELTYLLFFKLAEELGVDTEIPPSYRWTALASSSEDDLLADYKSALHNLGSADNERVREIFQGSGTKLRDSASLRRLLSGISAIDWYQSGQDGLGNIYEGLIEKNATESRYGAGQYFTPRALVDAMVSVSAPSPSDIIYDPAAGTAGFLIAAGLNTINAHHSPPTLIGHELVRDVQRMALMNLRLHGLDGTVGLGDTLNRVPDTVRATLCLTNPPFGVKGGISSEQQSHLDFPTSNKQLAFVQHVYKALAPGGRAAVVVPDNVLFEFGVASNIRSHLLDNYNLHTVLRLPAGIFYATGVKTSVLFFDNVANGTETTWFYDLRGVNGQSFTKRRQLKPSDLLDFVQCFGSPLDSRSRRTASDRFKPVERDQLRPTGDRLDLNTAEVTDHAGGSDSPIELVDILVRELDQALTAARELTAILREAHDDPHR